MDSNIKKNVLLAFELFIDQPSKLNPVCPKNLTSLICNSTTCDSRINLNYITLIPTCCKDNRRIFSIYGIKNKTGRH